MSVYKQTIRTLLTAVLPQHKFLVRGPKAGESSHFSSGDEGAFSQPIALTFDDGPHPEWTPRLLDQLAESQIRATFFVIGQRAEHHPRLIRRMVDEGHAVGNHTYTHGEPEETSAQKFLEEVQRTQTFLEDVTGKRCRLVRPPKGKLTFRKLRGLWKGGQTVVLWNVDPRDYRMHSHRDVRDWLGRYRPSAGDVVLWHDNHPFALTAVQLLSQSRHFPTLNFVPVSSWLPVQPKAQKSEPRPVA